MGGGPRTATCLRSKLLAQSLCLVKEPLQLPDRLKAGLSPHLSDLEPFACCALPARGGPWCFGLVHVGIPSNASTRGSFPEQLWNPAGRHKNKSPTLKPPGLRWSTES